MRDLPRMAETMRAIRDAGGSAEHLHTARNGWGWRTSDGATLNSALVADLVADGWLILETQPLHQPMRVRILHWPPFADRTTAELIAAREHVAELIDRDRAAMDCGFYGTPAPEPRDADNWS